MGRGGRQSAGGAVWRRWLGHGKYILPAAGIPGPSASNRALLALPIADRRLTLAPVSSLPSQSETSNFFLEYRILLGEGELVPPGGTPGMRVVAHRCESRGFWAGIPVLSLSREDQAVAPSRAWQRSAFFISCAYRDVRTRLPTRGSCRTRALFDLADRMGKAGLMDGAVPELPVDPLEVLRQRRSAKWQTYPADVLPLTVAEMDFALAAPIAEALREAVERSDAGYAMAVPDLGRALAGFAASRWNWDFDPASVTAVTDVGVGVVELLRVLTRPGDAVVISPPVYPPFFDWVPEAGARLLEVPLARDAAGWRLDLAALEAAFATHPAAYVLCNPHNPVGRVHTADELAALVRLARIYRVAIVSDEIHGPLVLPGATFTPLLTVPGAAEVAVSVLSASKAWNLAGLKCAAVVTAAPRHGRGDRPVPGRHPVAHWPLRRHRRRCGVHRRGALARPAPAHPRPSAAAAL